MIEHVLAAFGGFMLARFAIHEIVWRITRDPSGNSGRYSHWETER